MARYLFQVTLVGSGDNAEAAWADAVEGFTLDPGDASTADTTTIENEDDDEDV